MADPIEAVKAVEALHGVGEETWVGVHSTRPAGGGIAGCFLGSGSEDIARKAAELPPK
ncbi:hypothetical protein [Methanopyrus sp.]